MSDKQWSPEEISHVPDGLILFDGVCLLCAGVVRFVIKRDVSAWFRFTPIQSPYGRSLADRLRIRLDTPDAIAVVVRGSAYFKSDAAIRILQRLPRWSWAGMLLLVPRLPRNWLYDLVAGSRYRLFGRTESCMFPNPDVASRFLLDDPWKGSGISEITREVMRPRQSPFQVILGPRFDQLPEPVRRVHALSTCMHMAGRSEVSVANGLLPRLLCRIVGLPAPGDDVEVEVSLHPDGPDREYWRRRFSGRKYTSVIGVAKKGAEDLLLERIGVFDLYFRLTPSSAHLSWSLAAWRFLRMPLPRWSAPRLECVEAGQGRRFTFDIDAKFPLAGRVTRYRGWLLPVDQGR